MGQNALSPAREFKEYVVFSLLNLLIFRIWLMKLLTLLRFIDKVLVFCVLHDAIVEMIDWYRIRIVLGLIRFPILCISFTHWLTL